MKKIFGTIVLVLLFAPFSVYADTLISQISVNTVSEVNSITQTLSCSDLNGKTVNDVNVWGNSITNPFGISFTVTLVTDSGTFIGNSFANPSSPVFKANFSGADIECTNDITMILTANGGDTMRWYGITADVYAGGSCTANCGTIQDIRMVINGIITPFEKVGTGFYFFGESEPSQNASGQTATAIQGNLGVNLNSIWQVVLLALSIPLTFYIMQKLIMNFAFAYYGDRPKKKRQILTNKKPIE